MPHTGNPVRLADFTVRLFLPDNILSDEDRVNTIVWALNNLNLTIGDRPRGRHRRQGGRGPRARRPGGRSEPPARGHHAARPLRRRHRPAVRRAEPEHQGEEAGRQVPGRGRDRRRRGRAGDGHGRRPSLGRHRADGRGVQRGAGTAVSGSHQGDRAASGPDDADIPGPRRHEGPAATSMCCPA